MENTKTASTMLKKPDVKEGSGLLNTASELKVSSAHYNNDRNSIARIEIK